MVLKRELKEIIGHDAPFDLVSYEDTIPKGTPTGCLYFHI